jgi:hypothetical protein
MEKGKLNSLENSTIKLEIRQILLSFLALGIIVFIVASSLIMFLQRSEDLHLEKGFAITFVVFVSAAGFLGYLYFSVKDHLSDLRSGLKNTYAGQITEKYTNTNWGWHGNPAADATSQPKLDEYFIVAANQKVSVPKQDFDRLNVGDIVKLNISPRSNILLGIIKE